MGQVSAPLQILLAEDNIPNQRIIAIVLKNLGCEVESVTTGREALEAMDHKRFDLVLMDIRMPEMDGIEATRLARSRQANGVQLPIYALTAGIPEDERQMCINAGMDGFVSKPVDRNEVAALLAQLAANQL
jgi:CheY-like chemotaxis protein